MSENRTYRRHFKNYLLNWRYQLRYTLTIVAVSAALTGGLGFVVIQRTHETSRLVEVRAEDPEDLVAQQMKKDLEEQFAKSDRGLVMILVGFGVVLSGVLTLYGIVITHKVAGPLFKISTHLNQVRDGKLVEVWPIRKGDQLGEFFDQFKEAHDALKARTREDIALIDKAIAAVGDQPIANELRAAKAKKESSFT